MIDFLGSAVFLGRGASTNESTNIIITGLCCVIFIDLAVLTFQKVPCFRPRRSYFREVGQP